MGAPESPGALFPVLPWPPFGGGGGGGVCAEMLMLINKSAKNIKA